MNRPQKHSLINAILQYLQETSKGLLDLSIDIVFEPGKFMKGRAPYKNYAKHSVYNLKKNTYFAVRDNTFYLNAKGRIEIIKNIIKDKKKIKQWDHKWRAVIFDVPESNRKERNFLRGELKWMGFKELQHSIWIVPYQIEKELLCLLTLWQRDFKGDIRFLKIEKIVDDKDFKKVFSI